MPRKTVKGDVAADEAVYSAIRRAMHMGRLAPGTKLQEPVLARVLCAVSQNTHHNACFQVKSSVASWRLWR